MGGLLEFSRGIKEAMKRVALAILNFEGVAHLEILLPTALEAVRIYGDPCPILVLDNQSQTGDKEWVRTHFPTVEVIIASKNDYLFSYNELLQSREEEIVILLNNDLRLAPDFIPPLVKHFERPDVFATTSLSYDWEGKSVTSGPASFRIHHGWFYTEFDLSCSVATPTLFPTGGYAAVDRKKFLELGGFDRLYYPAYGEDLDLGYRAQQRGWVTIYEPESKVWHRENGSMTSKRAVHLILVSQFLFQWKNLRSFSIRWRRSIYIQWLRYCGWRKGEGAFEKAYQEAKEKFKPSIVCLEKKINHNDEKS